MLPRQGAVWWRGWERRQLPVPFFQFFFSRSAMQLRLATDTVSPVTHARMYASGLAGCNAMARAGHFFGARALGCD